MLIRERVMAFPEFTSLEWIIRSGETSASRRRRRSRRRDNRERAWIITVRAVH